MCFRIIPIENKISQWDGEYLVFIQKTYVYKALKLQVTNCLNWLTHSVDLYIAKGFYFFRKDFKQFSIRPEVWSE